MRRATVLITSAFLAQSRENEHMTLLSVATPDSVTKLVNRMIGNLVGRSSGEKPALCHADLDCVTLQKPGTLSAPRRVADLGFASLHPRPGPLPSHFRKIAAVRRDLTSGDVLSTHRPRLDGTKATRSISARSSSTGGESTQPDVGRLSKIPITVVTGFLGSGKTTLLNNILTKTHGKRIAVIENEYGEIGIDQDLVAAAKAGGGDEDSIMMLNNGCLCCTVRGDLVDMLKELTSKYREKFDHIVIETTGLASIAPIIQTFYAEPVIESSMFLDGVVTLVDAKHINRHLDEGSRRTGGATNEALEQVAYADRIVLNKIDLVSNTELSEVETRLQSVNGMAEIVHAKKAAVGVDYVLGIGGFDLDKIEAKGVVDAQDHAHHDHGNAAESCNECGKDGHHHHHHHDDKVGSISLEVPGDMDYDKIEVWMNHLLGEIHRDLYRMKGILSIYGFDRKYVFQGVHAMFEGTPHEHWKNGEQRTSKIVFIGKDLPKENIRTGFEQCVHPAR